MNCKTASPGAAPRAGSRAAALVIAGLVLAAALGRADADLVGEETAGRAPHLGIVEENGLRLVLPIAFWIGPDGEPLDGPGVVPGQEVEPGREGDPMLERALELARTGRARKAA